MINPTPKGTSEPSLHLGQHPSGCAQTMTTLHIPSIPAWGMHLPSLARKTRYQMSIAPVNHSKALPIYNHTYPSHSDLPFSILTSQPNKITNQQLPWSVSPWMPSLSMPWPCTTLQQTSHAVISLISNVICSTTFNDDWWSPAKYEDNTFSRDHLLALFNCQTMTSLTEPKNSDPQA